MLQLDASSKLVYKKFVPYFFTNAIKRLDFWQYIEPSRGQLPVTPYVLSYKTTTALALGKRYINQSRATRYRGLINIQLALSTVVAVASKKQTFLLCAIADGSRARDINVGTCRITPKRNPLEQDSSTPLAPQKGFASPQWMFHEKKQFIVRALHAS